MARMKAHRRVNDILLAPLERPALHWLSAHMPAWVNPDILTGVGVAGSVIVFLGYCLTNLDRSFLWLASLGIFVNWFGDSLDGTLARFRNIQRPKYGFFVDHTVDAVGMVLVFTGLGLSPYVRFNIALLALVGYLLMAILVYVNTCVNNEFKLSYSKIGPTEMRLVAVIANTLVYGIGNPVVRLPLGTAAVYDLIVLVIAVLLMVAFLVTTIRQARVLAGLEERPKRAPAGKPKRREDTRTDLSSG